jgi:hypothetical protein
VQDDTDHFKNLVDPYPPLTCAICGRPLAGSPHTYLLTSPTAYHVYCHQLFHRELWKRANQGKSIAHIKGIVKDEVDACYPKGKV